MQVLISDLVCLGSLHKVKSLLSFIKPKIDQIASNNLKKLLGRWLLLFFFVDGFDDLDILHIWRFAFFRLRDFSLLVWASAIDYSSLGSTSIVAFYHLYNLGEALGHSLGCWLSVVRVDVRGDCGDEFLGFGSLLSQSFFDSLCDVVKHYKDNKRIS